MYSGDDYYGDDVTSPLERPLFSGYRGGPLMNPLARVQETPSCPECNGTGTCAACNGSGAVVGVIGDDERTYTCGTCDGDGFCSFCSGSGELEDVD